MLLLRPGAGGGGGRGGICDSPPPQPGSGLAVSPGFELASHAAAVHARAARAASPAPTPRPPARRCAETVAERKPRVSGTIHPARPRRRLALTEVRSRGRASCQPGQRTAACLDGGQIGCLCKLAARQFSLAIEARGAPLQSLQGGVLSYNITFTR